MNFTRIVTHPGGAHMDEFLACAVLLARHPVTIERREPTPEDLENHATAVVDVGHEHHAAKGNFDHHQFPKDHPPVCSLSLVLQHLDVYEDARKFCDWLETTERFDTRGPVETARWLGVERATLPKLHSPVDVTLLRRFAKSAVVSPGEPLWEIMRWIGEDLLHYVAEVRARLGFLAQHGKILAIPAGGETVSIFFLPRVEPLGTEPSSGIDRFLKTHPQGGDVAGLIYPDRRGAGYGLSRHKDHPGLDFTQIQSEPDVHFAHVRGFVAKTSATDPVRLAALVSASWIGAPRDSD
ncbi:MAG: MYG1 family protein [Verrucomicrobiota bacterium]